MVWRILWWLGVGEKSLFLVGALALGEAVFLQGLTFGEMQVVFPAHKSKETKLGHCSQKAI